VTLAGGAAESHPDRVTTPGNDPRARFRQLPEPVRREDLVETIDPDPPMVVETTPQVDQRLWMAGGAATP
jgi:hypothetical protein